MPDQLPIVPVPESTWLRALAHALDPEAEASDASLAPDDDPVAASADELDTDGATDDDATDGDGGSHEDAADVDSSTEVDDSDPNAWDCGDTWSPSDEADDAPAHLHHDDGVG